MDDLFKALADPARRTLLDSLRDRDGQTLQDLQGLLDMTRFGVMKHLGVLEEAGLITTKRWGASSITTSTPCPCRKRLTAGSTPTGSNPRPERYLTSNISLKTKETPRCRNPIS